MSKREFRLDNEYPYNRSTPVRWILSHVMRYPLLPLVAFTAAVIVSLVSSLTQVIIGRAFDLIVQPDWEISALLLLAAAVFVLAIASGLFSLLRNFSTEFIAQRFERDSRDELYSDLLGKSQTFHGRQRIGDIMAHATNDVRTAQYHVQPRLDAHLRYRFGHLVPVIMIAFLDITADLLVPLLFLIGFMITVWDYARQLNPVSASLREQFGIMNAGLAETISGIEVVKGNAQEAAGAGEIRRRCRPIPRLFRSPGRDPGPYLPMLVFSIAWAGGLFACRAPLAGR